MLHLGEDLRQRCEHVEKENVSVYRKLYDDLYNIGENISLNRIWRLARLAGIRVQIGYKKQPDSYGGIPVVVADNTFNRAFSVDAPNQF